MISKMTFRNFPAVRRQIREGNRPTCQFCGTNTHVDIDRHDPPAPSGWRCQGCGHVESCSY